VQRAARRLIVAAILAGIMLKAMVVALESKLVFFPTAGEGETPGSLGIPYETVRLHTSDGETLVAWQLEPEHAVADVVYFHGNGGNLSIWLPVLATLHASGLRVLALDYRGYGLSTGSPTEAGVYRDAAAVAQHSARAQSGGRPRPLVFWGRSLGGAIAASATRTVTPDALILESSFADKAAVIRANPVLRALNLFGSYRFNTVEMLRGFQKPVLVLHGDRDGVVPFSAGRELFEQLGAPKKFVTIRGGDHNDLLDLSRTDYWKPVFQFITGLHRR
jgi:alpha-beta hydrolase superfamily lysophospholipase